MKGNECYEIYVEKLERKIVSSDIYHNLIF